MIGATKATPRSPGDAALRVTLVACLFYAAFGAFLQWFPVWLIDARGFTGGQLGLAIAWAGIGRIFVGPLTSAWAEGRRDRRAPLLLLAVLSMAGLLALGMGPAFGVSFALAFGLEISVWGIIAFLEAALLRLTTAASRPRYGVARGLASLAFVAGNIGVGILIDRFGNWAVWVWLAVTVWGLIVALTRLPAEPIRRSAAVGFGARLTGGLAMLRVPDFALLIFGCGLIQAAHQYYYIFGTKLWIAATGMSAATAGWLFALGVIAEAALLMGFAARLERYRPATLMIAGGIGALLRWTLMAQDPGITGLALLQLLHAASFALTFLGSMRGIMALWGHQRTPTAQMMFMALATAPAQALASYASGRLYEAGWGERGYLAMAGFAAAGLVPVLLLWWRGARSAA
ncbi:MAG: MFS transporter [Polymorphobacter sp.]